MSKKHHKQPQEQVPPLPASPEPQHTFSQVPQEPRPESVPLPSKLIWVFWGGVAAVLAAARILDQVMPGTPERIIERWLMLAFAGFLGLFLLKLK